MVVAEALQHPTVVDRGMSSRTDKRVAPDKEGVADNQWLALIDLKPGQMRPTQVLGLKGQRSRSQGHKVQKHIEGDRAADVSYAL